MKLRQTSKSRSEAGLTVFETFPLLLAVFVTVVSGMIMTKYFGDSFFVWIPAAALGAGAWILYAQIIIRLRR